MIKGLTKLLILSVLIFSASTPVYSSEEDEVIKFIKEWDNSNKKHACCTEPKLFFVSTFNSFLAECNGQKKQLT